jgi:hypothetical protein
VLTGRECILDALLGANEAGNMPINYQLPTLERHSNLLCHSVATQVANGSGMLCTPQLEEVYAAKPQISSAHDLQLHG